MYVFQIKDVSKEENLQNALNHSLAAKELLAKIADLTAEGNALVPVKTIGLSESKKAKAKTIEEVVKRLQCATYAHSRTESYYENIEREKVKKEKLEQERALIENAKAIQVSHVNLAIEYCLKNQLVFGKDFTVETAVRAADDFAFNLKVQENESTIGDDYIEFNGHNCQDECDGWNPKDHRCQCGNRRVSWSSYGSFNDMYIYAEAY